MSSNNITSRLHAKLAPLLEALQASPSSPTCCRLRRRVELAVRYGARVHERSALGGVHRAQVSWNTQHTHVSFPVALQNKGFFKCCKLEQKEDIRGSGIENKLLPLTMCGSAAFRHYGFSSFSSKISVSAVAAALDRA